MHSNKRLLGSYAFILALGITSLATGVHYYANIAGFFSAIGFMLVFFKDPKEDISEAELAAENAMKKKWYIVFATGLLFSLILGTFWNDELGNME